ncbi:hypothetical protein [Kineococcus aurantiacus]|uniref:DUF559 domain-containing protein n=1 Tax=Kineococcus aurantiacus TaxID=37633 RepID=A0A7Y9AUY0_9ACTN|nr:hypothetical protein [Kineococcus aurantiacus]NYD20805.1 hypothetical protein [Kineococcus aurantiacus]
MPRPRTFDPADVDALLRRQDGIATHAQLVQTGMTVSTIARWANRGPWQRVLPGVVAGHRGTLTQRQRRLGALAYAGVDAVLSGEHAMDLHGTTTDRIRVLPQVLVLVPWTRTRLSSGFVTVERTERPPRVQLCAGLPTAPPARAAADAARHGADVDRVRELFGATLHRGRCTLAELVTEVLEGPTQRSAAARAVLTEASAGTRSAAEGRVHRVVARSSLPQPLWNEDVVVGGLFVGTADAWWPDLGVALEVDSIRWHSTPGDLRRTQAKQRRYAAAGVLLLTVAPSDVTRDPAGFLRQLATTLEAGARRRSG